MRQKQILYVTGLPRSGATLLCQLLSHHPDIDSQGTHSPLCAALVNLRQHLGQNDDLLAQLDHDVEATYQQLIQACQGLLQGWFAHCSSPWIANHSLAWLAQIEMVHLLDPQFRMVVCIRELGQIYGSIEAQHQQTQLLNLPQRLAGLSRAERAKKLFEPDGWVGSALRALDAVQDLDAALQSRLYYIVFEHFLSDPTAVLADLYRWLELPEATFNPQQLAHTTSNHQSYHRLGYAPTTYRQINPMTHHPVPQRFDLTLKENFTWYYSTFYPGLI